MHVHKSADRSFVFILTLNGKLSFSILTPRYLVSERLKKISEKDPFKPNVFQNGS